MKSLSVTHHSNESYGAVGGSNVQCGHSNNGYWTVALWRVANHAAKGGSNFWVLATRRGPWMRLIPSYCWAMHSCNLLYYGWQTRCSSLLIEFADGILKCAHWDESHWIVLSCAVGLSWSLNVKSRQVWAFKLWQLSKSFPVLRFCLQFLPSE